MKELLDYNIGGFVKKKIEYIEQNLQNLLCIKIIRTFIILVCKGSYKCLWSTFGNSPSLLLFCLFFFFQCSTTVAQIKAVCISFCTWPLFMDDWKYLKAVCISCCSWPLFMTDWKCLKAVCISCCTWPLYMDDWKCLKAVCISCCTRPLFMDDWKCLKAVCISCCT